jgi:hypothetical protein
MPMAVPDQLLAMMDDVAAAMPEKTSQWLSPI